MNRTKKAGLSVKSGLQETGRKYTFMPDFHY